MERSCRLAEGPQSIPLKQVEQHASRSLHCTDHVPIASHVRVRARHMHVRIEAALREALIPGMGSKFPWEVSSRVSYEYQ